jgi:FkbM family methyltransferase
MPIRPSELRDAGMRNLFFRETRCGGYEYSSRIFLHEHLAPGDAFIDAGAHRGVFSLSAWFAKPKQVEVLAVEPHPDNARGLEFWARRNKIDSNFRIFQTAVADRAGRSLLRLDSSMGHRLAGSDTAAQGAGQPLEVPVATLDGLLAEHPLRSDGRVFLKIDVEGAEPAVLQGARELLRSGRVAAVIWEKGMEYDQSPGRERFLHGLQMLTDLGFEHFRFPHEDLAGPLVPYVPSPEQLNVISLERGFPRRDVYPRPFRPPFPLPSRMRRPFTREEMEAYAGRLIRARTTDAGRWTREENLVKNAHLRCGIAGERIPAGASVLDVGCGLMALALFLREGAYTPLDVVARSRECLVRDLNRQGLPEGRWDWAAALHLLEFIHEPEALLRELASRCGNLVLSYHTAETVAPDQRRAAGFFNDYTRQGLLNALDAAGWRPMRQESVLAETLVVCQTKDSA